uniref:Reverse transcriptase zinc-binding domain-containing protein n=1 Tax=Brassica oleracea TaxID=3712 RepID=A0A3P6E7D4_BRAOL|nr:unnamed protein product [Brassica oleracea]
MVWLAFKDRLSTVVRMRDWGVEQGCVYCGERNEDRDHLYFACPYTFTVWMNVAERRNRLDIVLLRLVFSDFHLCSMEGKKLKKTQGCLRFGGHDDSGHWEAGEEPYIFPQVQRKS